MSRDPALRQVGQKDLKKARLGYITAQERRKNEGSGGGGKERRKAKIHNIIKILYHASDCQCGEHFMSTVSSGAT